MDRFHADRTSSRRARDLLGLSSRVLVQTEAVLVQGGEGLGTQPLPQPCAMSCEGLGHVLDPF